MKICIIVLVVFLNLFKLIAVSAGERIYLKSPVLYYECIDCTDTPNISHPAYAVLYQPVVKNWDKFKQKKQVLSLLKIPQYLKGEVKRVSADKFYAPEVRLMIVGLLDFPVMVDRYSYVNNG